MQIFKDINIDGIYYADEGILYIAQEMNIQNKLIYQPETLVTSSMDVISIWNKAYRLSVWLMR